MKWTAKRKTEYEGVLFVHQVVNQQGSIYRPIHQEEDTGIDGIIELVEDEEAQGLLVAVQVKSGDSYARADKFIVPVDEAHLVYWQSLMLPVVVVCYSPSRELAAWQSLSHYLESHKNHKAIRHIEVPFRRTFNQAALSKGLRSVAREHKDRSVLFKCADRTLDPSPEKRKEGMLLLTLHPTSRATRLTAFLAGQLILDDDLGVVRAATSALSFCVAHRKWSFRPNFELIRHDAVMPMRWALSRCTATVGSSAWSSRASCCGDSRPLPMKASLISTRSAISPARS